MYKIFLYTFCVSLSVIFYWVFVPLKWRGKFLLLCSILFISSYSALYALYFFFNCFIIYAAGIYIRKKAGLKKNILKITVIWLVLNLFFLKSKILQIFIFENILGKGLLNLLFPLGLSYIIFRLIHYIVEVYKDNINEGSFADLANYALFYPTFLAGPIERFQVFYRQSQDIRNFDLQKFNYGLFRIILGFIKKFLIADSLAKIIISIFSSPESFPRLVIASGVYGLMAIVYFDFSGYSDIAIGISALFGYSIVENFNHPYLQKNVASFWRSWHISLYSWFRDYLFFPFAGSRASTFKLYLGIFLTLLATNLWHSLSLRWLISGIYCGFALTAWQLFQKTKQRLPELKRFFSQKWLDPLSIFLTVSFISFWILFLFFDLPDALAILKRIFI